MEGARASSAPLKWALLCTFLCLSLDLARCGVTYNGKSLIIDGRQRILFSGSIHYPRSPPQVLHMFSDFSFFWFWHSSDEMLVLCGHSFLTRVFDVNAENADVGSPHSEGERWRAGCYRHLRVLEYSRAISWKCNTSLSPSPSLVLSFPLMICLWSSITLKGDTTWFSSSRQSGMLGSMYIFASGLTFVGNGISGL